MAMAEIHTQLKIAVVGLGLIGPRHAMSIQRCAGAELHCVVDPSPGAQVAVEELGVPLFSSIEQMVKEKYLPDAAIVCTPNHSHFSVSEELLALGVHVLVEKPISTDIASGMKFIEAARKADRKLLVGHHRRFNPYVSATKKALSEEVIGKPIAISGLWVTYKPPSYFEEPTAWRAQAGTGGPILINLIHEVDILQYLLGPIVRVHAETSISQRKHEVEEGAAILLRFESGVVGTFILSDACPSTHNFESSTGENPMIPQAKPRSDFYRIFGSEAALSVGDMRVERYGEGMEKSWTNRSDVDEIEVGEEVPFDEQVRNFVGCIKGSEQPRCTGEDGLRALLVCDAVVKAMESGEAVDIPRDWTFA